MKAKRIREIVARYNLPMKTKDSPSTPWRPYVRPDMQGELQGWLLLLAQQSVDEAFNFEWREIIGAFAQAYKLDWNTQFFLYLEDDSALSGAVQLGENHTGDIYYLAEDSCLRKAILPHRGIQYQQDLVHISLLFYHALDLA